MAPQTFPQVGSTGREVDRRVLQPVGRGPTTARFATPAALAASNRSCARVG